MSILLQLNCNHSCIVNQCSLAIWLLSYFIIHIFRLIDWLDEYNPGSFRQAQVSFSSRIPLVIPFGDATTMSTHLQLYCNEKPMRQMLQDNSSYVDPASLNNKYSGHNSDSSLLPHIYMLTKHSNGSLNQWQVSFAESSKYSTVLSICHNSRACGHRFRTNSAASHAVLPLLLTSSHHNTPKGKRYSGKNSKKLFWIYQVESICQGLVVHVCKQTRTQPKSDCSDWHKYEWAYYEFLCPACTTLILVVICFILHLSYLKKIIVGMFAKSFIKYNIANYFDLSQYHWYWIFRTENRA